MSNLIEQIALALNGQHQTNGSYKCLCPAHDDHTPSLSAWCEGDKVLVKCFAGCTYPAIKEALKKYNIDLDTVSTEYKLVASYNYYDRDRALVFTKKRLERTVNGKKEKKFPIGVIQPDGTFLSGKPKLDYIPLYNEFALTCADKADTVYLVEGEKDVETLRTHGFLAVTVAFGAHIKNWDGDQYNQLFNGRTVVLLPDNDVKGIAFMNAVAIQLANYASKLKVVNLSHKQKGDVTDFLAQHTVADMIRTIDQAPESYHWRGELQITAQGKPLASEYNAVMALTHAPEFKGKIKYNRFSFTVDILEALPWDNIQATYPRTLTDYDIIAFMIWCQNPVNNINIKNTHSHNAFISVAQQNSYNPLQDYLNGLVWDGKPRLDTFFKNYMGSDGDANYLRVAGSKWFISAVSRALRPGNQADSMVVLEGSQGAGKSSGLKALVPDEKWFIDNLPRIDKPDAMLYLLGRWIVEAAEFEAFSREDVKKIKEFITHTTDKFRPPYGRVVEDHPRQCVLAGTINPNGVGYLKDSTGARRFWPVPVGMVDVVSIKQDRDQIWAEAVARFNKGEIWWLTAEEEKLFETEQDDRFNEHPLAESIRWFITHEPRNTYNDIMRAENIDWVERHEPLTYFFPRDFFKGVVGKSFDQVEYKDRVVVGHTLKKMGWENKSLRRGGRVEKGWVNTFQETPKQPIPPTGGDNQPKNVTNVTKCNQDKTEVGYTDNLGKACVARNVTNVTENFTHTRETQNTGAHTHTHNINNTNILGYKVTEGIMVNKNYISKESIVVIDRLEEAIEAIKQINSYDEVALDFETVGLKPWEANTRARLAQFWCKEGGFIVDLDKIGGLKAIAGYMTAPYIGFNSTFEMTWLDHAGNNVILNDLKLMWAVKFGGNISLKDCVKRVLGIEMAKEQQRSDWSGELTDEQLQYAILDAKYTYEAWVALKQHCTARHREAYDVLVAAQPAIVELCKNGVAFDKDAHALIVAKYERELRILTRLLNRWVPSVQNWGSPKQVDAWLKSVLPADVLASWGKTEKTGLLQATPENIDKFMDKVPVGVAKVLNVLLRIKDAQKVVSAFGASLAGFLGEDGRLRGDFRMVGAITGRMTSSKPNLQQMPRDKGFRDLFVAETGKKLVVADYSQVEVRVGAELAGDKRLREIFASGHDVHTATAADMFRVSLGEVTKEQRTEAKTVTFGMQYGMGYATLAKRLKISEAKAQDKIARWEATFPELAKWRGESAYYGKKNSRLVLASGREIAFDWAPSKQACYNYPVQGMAGDVMYKALGLLAIELRKIGAKLLLCVHDEVVIEVADEKAEEAKEILEKCMGDAYAFFFDGCRENLVEAKICGKWSEK